VASRHCSVRIAFAPLRRTGTSGLMKVHPFEDERQAVSLFRHLAMQKQKREATDRAQSVDIRADGSRFPHRVNDSATIDCQGFRHQSRCGAKT
jgi:hypothetical protein